MFEVIDELGLPLHITYWSGKLDDLIESEEIKDRALLRPSKGRAMMSDPRWKRFGEFCYYQQQQFLGVHDEGIVERDGTVNFTSRVDRLRAFLQGD